MTPTAAAGAMRMRVPRLALGPIMVLVAWQGLAVAVPGDFLVAGPWEVAGHLWQNAGLYFRALQTTLAAAATGFLIGNLLAVALAALALLLPRAEALIAGLALLVFCLPLVATGPILRVLYGPGTGPQVTLAALAVYYTTFVPVLVGLRATPAAWLDLVRSYGRGRFAMLWHIRARAALPYLVAGLQIAAPAAFLGAMVGEFTGAERGMGILTLQAMRGLDTEATWTLATVAAAVSIAAHGGIGWLARHALSEPPPVLLAPPQTGSGPGLWSGLRGILVVGVVAIALWWALLQIAGLNPFFAKGPGDVWAFLVSGPGADENRATLLAALAETTGALGPGYIAGMAMGAALAVVVTLAPALSAVVMPVAIALRAVPIVTTVPLLVLVVGRGPVGSAALVAVMVFFPTLVACLYGLQRAPGQVLDVMASYGAGRGKALLYARLPAMLPAFFAAARMAVPAAVLAVTVVEWLATGRGLGALMAVSASLSDYGTLWSATVLTAVLAALVYGVVARIERRVLAVFASEQAQ